MTSDGDSADRPKGSIFDLFSNKSYKKHARALAKKKTTWPATEDLLAAIIANSKNQYHQWCSIICAGAWMVRRRSPVDESPPIPSL